MAAPSIVEPELAAVEAVIASERERHGIVVNGDGPKQIASVFSPERMAEFAKPNPERDAQIAAEDAAAERRRMADDQATDWRNVLTGAGTEYANCTLENYRLGMVPVEYQKFQSSAHAAVVEYASRLSVRWKEKSGIVLFGPVGTGKDHLAVGVCREAIQQRMRVGWVACQRWFAELRDSIDARIPEGQILAGLLAPHLLVLSDPLPNVGEITPHQSTWLFRLADARQSRGKLTILTINVADDAEADKRLGEATWDRLCYRAWKIKCDWPSYRKPSKTVNC